MVYTLIESSQKFWILLEHYFFCEYFSKQRGRHCDRVETYDKGVGTSRLRQKNQEELQKSTNTYSTSIRSARQFNRTQNHS